MIEWLEPQNLCVYVSDVTASEYFATLSPRRHDSEVLCMTDIPVKVWRCDSLFFKSVMYTPAVHAFMMNSCSASTSPVLFHQRSHTSHAPQWPLQDVSYQRPFKGSHSTLEPRLRCFRAFSQSYKTECNSTGLDRCLYNGWLRSQ